jgi:hypothetical protein
VRFSVFGGILGFTLIYVGACIWLLGEFKRFWGFARGSTWGCRGGGTLVFPPVVWENVLS